MLFLVKILKKENILMKSVYYIPMYSSIYIFQSVCEFMTLNFITHAQNTYFEWFWFEKCYFFLKDCIYFIYHNVLVCPKIIRNGRDLKRFYRYLPICDGVNFDQIHSIVWFIFITCFQHIIFNNFNICVKVEFSVLSIPTLASLYL